MQFPYNARFSLAALPPLYIWPESLKRIILVLAVIACSSAYILLVGGLLGAGVLVLKMILGW